jgi:hypothetical protein
MVSDGKVKKTLESSKIEIFSWPPRLYSLQDLDSNGFL